MRTPADANPAWQCPSCHIAYAKYGIVRAPLHRRLAAESREMAAEARVDRSVYVLIGANLLALALGHALGMGLRDLMLVYWIQSVVIGIAMFVRILSLKRFSTDGMKANDKPVPETPQARLGVALFFALHYGGFHFAYLMFIGFKQRGELAAPLTYLVLALVFAANHAYSLAHNIRRDAQGRPNLGKLMTLPYARILPMHLTIVLGGSFSGGALAYLFFGLLKTAADVAMHTLEHHLLADIGNRGQDPSSASQ